MNTDFAEWMREVQARVETALGLLVATATATGSAGSDMATTQTSGRLLEAMRYSLLGGGKRVRPLLAFAAGELTGATRAPLELVACALECIHVYSLVHDDLPCMDDDVLRRGRPTCHVAFDEPTALLVGDSLQTLAFELLSRPHGLEALEAVRQLEMVRILAQASGAYGMAGGQAIDLASVGQPLTQAELERMHRLKTGALIQAAIVLGALCGNALTLEERAMLDRFAQSAGLLFQVVDDILDCTASTETLGKTAGKDVAADKPTYVSLLGLDGARSYAAKLESEALSSLQVFGKRAERLAEIATFIAHRKF